MITLRLPYTLAADRFIFAIYYPIFLIEILPCVCVCFSFVCCFLLTDGMDRLETIPYIYNISIYSKEDAQEVP